MPELSLSLTICSSHPNDIGYLVYTNLDFWTLDLQVTNLIGAHATSYQ